MDDAAFVDTVMVLERSIALFVLFRAVLWVLSMCVCALVIFLLIRRRRQELAIMRSMGCSTFLLYGQVLCEITVCAILGAILALAAASKLPVGEIWNVTVVLLVGCLLAAAGSITAVICGNIMRILKGKE